MAGMDLGAGSFSFENVGDEIEGIIVSTDKRQQTKMETDEPEFWSDGSPKMLIIVQLQTQLSDGPTDDGRRTIFISGHKYTATKKVTNRLDDGAWLKMKRLEDSDRPPKVKGGRQAHLFRAWYKPPADAGVTLTDQPPF